MPSRKVWIAGLTAAALWTPPLPAQIPGMSAGAGAGPLAGLAGGATTPAATAAPAAAAQPTTLCSFIGLGPALANCKAALCASNFGQMLNSFGGGPMAAVTGGFLPQLCPPLSSAAAAAAAANLPGGPNGAAATAAKIKASEAEAKARVAAIEYLGTVDCTRWPEAQTALINGLRKDTNECVRFAAAKALNSGCCCDKKVIQALRDCVSGEATEDPAETSPRVKAAAFSALQNCLLKVPEDLPAETVPVGPERTTPNVAPLPSGPERTTRNAGENPHLAVGYTTTAARTTPTFEQRLQRKTFAQTVEEARRTLFEAARHPRAPKSIPTGQRSLFGALAKARQDRNAANIRRAREQGQLPPRPAPPQFPAEPGVEPTANPPIAAPAPAPAPMMTPAADPLPEGAVGSEPGPMSNAEPAPATPASSTSPARRGLIGMLLAPGDR